MRRTQWMGCTFAAAVALTIVACGGGGGGGGTPTTPTPNPTPTPGGTTITIGTDGRVSPASLTVSPGTRVTFVNSHNRQHDMSSDPHPEHSDCREINDVGNLQPGQSRQTGNLNTARTCGFHDHNDPTNTGVMGRIVIQ
jgi:plastocyanin